MHRLIKGMKRYEKRGKMYEAIAAIHKMEDAEERRHEEREEELEMAERRLIDRKFRM
jgi:hypothetical protein